MPPTHCFFEPRCSTVRHAGPTLCAVLATSLIVCLAACGGHPESDDIARFAGEATAQRKGVEVTVRLDGCVADQTFLSSQDVPVRVRGRDGRLLANVRSDHRGEFALRLPASTNLTVEVDRQGGDVVQVPGLWRDTVMPLCLITRSDEG